LRPAHSLQRQQQSADDPGAKACEATCICCVGLLFLQVIWIVYTYGLDGTVSLLMAPETGRGLHTLSGPAFFAYSAVSPPAGYDARVLVLHDAAAGLQRVHYSVDGAARVVEHDAVTRTTRWLVYEPGATAPLARCFVLDGNSSALALGLTHPAKSFGASNAFSALPTPEPLPALRYERSECVPFSLSGSGGEWASSPWPTHFVAPRLGPAAPRHGVWCGTRRGGAHDCCSGKPCAACSKDAGSAACLKECPPVDALDMACAEHATCASAAGWAEPCRPGGAACACDAALGKAARAVKCDSPACKASAKARHSCSTLCSLR